MADATCPHCGDWFERHRSNVVYCSRQCRDRARERRRMVPCSVCGEPMHTSRTSRPAGESRHRRCSVGFTNGERRHGLVYTYKSGCRCTECCEAKSVAMRAWHAEHSYWSRPDVVVRRKAQRSTVEAREYERERWSRYYSENRDAVVANSKAKEARRKGASSIPFTAEQLDARLSMWAGCWMCGCDLGDDFHVDHVKPLSRGGWHCLSNLRPACARCNISKGAKWPLNQVLTLTV